MSCNKYREMISALLDSELSAEEEKVLSSHLESCSDCSRFADELKALKEIGDEATAEPMPSALETRIMSRTVGSIGEKRSLWSYVQGYYRIPRGLAWVTMLAALVLVTDAIVKTNLGPTTVDQTPVEIQALDNTKTTVKRIVLSEDDVVSTSIILKPTEDG